MDTRTDGRRMAVVAGLVALLIGPVAAQAGLGVNEGLIDTAEYLIQVGRFEEAAETFRKILASNPPPAEVLRLRERIGYDLLAPLIDHAVLGPPVRDFLRRASEAIAFNRQDPAHINEMIRLLGMPRRELAVQQLRLSGPYAVPHLMAALMDDAQVEWRPRVEAVLARMPDEAIPAMVEGLHCPDLTVRAALADALGQIGSPLALPELKRMTEDQDLSEAVRVPAEVAIRTILGRRAWTALPAREQYLQLVMAFHDRAPWTIPPGADETVPVWTFDQKAGRLTHTVVPRTQYAPLMAERTVERMLAWWPDYEPALPAWYLAKLGRLWEAEERPAEGWSAEAIRKDLEVLGALLGDRRLIAGLKVALERREWAAALGFLEALNQVGTARTVSVDPTVVSALKAPDRRVQYEAALAIVSADPQNPFEGSDEVVPLLAEALALGFPREILAVTDDLEEVNRFRGLFRQAGYTVHDVRTAAQAWDLLVDAPAVELVMVDADMAAPGAAVFVRQVRTDPRTRTIPVMLLAGTEEAAAALTDSLVRRYARVSVVQKMRVPEHLFERGMASIREAYGTPVQGEAATAVSWRSAVALSRLGRGHPVFPLSAAQAQLVAAATNGPDRLRLVAAIALAKLGNARCQAALAQAVLSKDSPPLVAQAALETLVETIRREGRLISPETVADLATLVESDDPTTRTLAAKLLGVTGVPTRDVPAAYRQASGRP